MERFRDFVFDHRRALAAACAALATLIAIDSLQPQSDAVSLTVVAHDIESGHVLTEDDLTTARVPAAAVPDEALDVADAVGRRAGGPMRRGEPVTDLRVLSPRSFDGDVLSMVRIEDPASVTGLQVGDAVDVVSTAGEDGARIVVRGAIIASLPAADDTSAATIGLTSSEEDALTLATVAVSGGIRLVVTRS